MIPDKLLRKHIDSKQYRVDLSKRLNHQLFGPELTDLVSIVRRIALSQRDSIEIAEGTPGRDAIHAYLCGIERIAAREYAMTIQLDSMMFGNFDERLEALNSIQFPKPNEPHDDCLCWSRDAFEAFIRCREFDTETTQALSDARQALEELRIAKADAEYAIGELNRLAKQLATNNESQEIRTIWCRIRETAPTIASILSAIASIAKLLS